VEDQTPVLLLATNHSTRPLPRICIAVCTRPRDAATSSRRKTRPDCYSLQVETTCSSTVIGVSYVRASSTIVTFAYWPENMQDPNLCCERLHACGCLHLPHHVAVATFRLCLQDIQSDRVYNLRVKTRTDASRFERQLVVQFVRFGFGNVL
jgi:hypothetical protein